MNAESIDARVTVLGFIIAFDLKNLHRHMLILQCKTQALIANHWEVKLSCLAPRRCGVSVSKLLHRELWKSNTSQGIFYATLYSAGLLPLQTYCYGQILLKFSSYSAQIVDSGQPVLIL